MDASLSCQKDRFSLPPGVHYLNCAYMSPMPRRVEAAAIRGLRRKRLPSRIRPNDFFKESDRLRRLFARVIGAPDPQRIAIVPAVSYGMAVVARNLDLAAGQNVVTAEEQFPSNVYAWRRLVDEARALGYAVEAPAWRGAHLFGLRVPAGASMDALRARLEARRVAVSVRGSAIRVAPNVYNDAADIAALGEALREGVSERT